MKEKVRESSRGEKLTRGMKDILEHVMCMFASVLFNIQQEKTVGGNVKLLHGIKKRKAKPTK